MIDLENGSDSRREKVFQLLFSVDFNEERSYEENLDTFFDEDDKIDAKSYIYSTYTGCCNYRQTADGLISSDTKKWSIERMSPVVRTALRLSVYEMFNTDVPVKVSINEAVNLVKKYGDEKEPSYVNGILNRIAKDNGKL